jgi:glycosyltransferase involved in cell wall biosynthesis
MTERSAPSVCLCVPTFRRPDGLRKLLARVAQLDYPGKLGIIVVDNDARDRAGDTIVQQAAPNFRFRLTAYVEPQLGHTYAYNRAFARACRTTPAPDYIAVLDDDEYPAPQWLAEMVTVSLDFDADIVGGPVFPVFEDPGHWLARSGLFEPIRYPTGRIPMISGAGNMLIRRSVLEQYLDEPFNHAFAFTGGSDSEFFRRCKRDGRSFAWADDAYIFESTPRSRTNVGYILRRKFRTGTEATRIERELRGLRGSMLHWFKGFCLLGFGILSLPIAACGGRRGIMTSLMRAARGAGHIAAEFGILYEEYREPR